MNYWYFRELFWVEFSLIYGLCLNSMILTTSNGSVGVPYMLSV